MAFEKMIVRVGRRRTRPHDAANDSFAVTSLKIGGDAGTEVTTSNLVTSDNTVTFTNKTFDVDATGNVLSNIANANIKTGAAIDESKLNLDYGTAALNTSITTHIGDTANPHSVTKTQVGLSNVTNDAQLPLAGGTMSGDINMNSNSITNLPTPTNAGDAVNLAYAQQLALTGGTVKEALLLSEQMDDTQGILAAGVAFIAVQPAANDTFIVTDGTNTETYTFKASESVAFDVAIGASVSDTMANLAQAILDDSTYWNAKFSLDGLDSINLDGVVVVYEKTTAAGSSTTRFYGVIANAQSDIQVLDYSAEAEYKTSLVPADLPSTDPAAGTFGIRKQQSALVNGELHVALESDVIKSWDDDGGTWKTFSGSGSLPDATSASGGGIKGKVTADSDLGLTISGGVMSVKVDSTTISIDGSGQIYIPTNGVNTTQLAGTSVTAAKLGSDVAGTGLTGGNGSALAVDFGLSGSVAVSATDLASNLTGRGASLLGIEDSGALITATTVEGALAENRTAINTNAGDISTNAGNISTNAGNISTNAGDISTINGTGISAGNGITTSGTIGGANLTVTASVDGTSIVSNGGSGTQLAVGADGIGTAEILIENDSYVTARNAGDTADVNTFKVNTSDQVEMASFWYTPASAPTADYQVSNKKYVDDALVSLSYRSLTASGWSGGTGTQALIGDIGYVDTDGLVKPAESGVTNIEKKRIVVCADATINNSAAGNWYVLPASAVGDDSGMVTVTNGEEVYLSSTAGQATQDINSITTGEPIILLGYGLAANDWEFVRPEYIADA